MNFREEFNLSIRARCAVLYVTTREEERLLSVVKDCAAELENMRVVSWDFASGFDVGVAVGKGNPIAVLDFIAKEPADTPILYVLKDFHRFPGGQYGLPHGKKPCRPAQAPAEEHPHSHPRRCATPTSSKRSRRSSPMSSAWPLTACCFLPRYCPSPSMAV